MKTALMIAFLIFGQQYNIELAVTPQEQARGLMFRQSWDDIQGMLFVNQKPRQVSFWMKNTYLNMSIIYLDKDYNILEIHHPTPLSEKGITSKGQNVQYILELRPDLEKNTVKNWEQFKKSLKQAVLEKENDINKLLKI